MSARDNILRRVRAALGPADAGRDERIAAKLSQHPRGPLPAMAWEPVGRFRQCCIGLSSTFDEVSNLAAVPAAVAQFLIANNLPTQAICWPEFADLPWAASALEVQPRAANGDDKIGITGCFCAIAETGTLMMYSGPTTSLTSSLLPDVHIALVRRSRLVRAMEDGWDLLRREVGDMPRQVSFVSGPSRTADIEMTMVLGIHGPYKAHVVLVND